MALVPIFRGLVTPKGRLILRETERERRQEWLHQLAASNIEMILRKERRQRSLDVNAYIHAVPVFLVSRETGDDPDDVKRDLMTACFGTVPGENGPEPWQAHTSGMDDEQGRYFIEWAPAYILRKFGVEVPLPGEVAIYR